MSYQVNESEELMKKEQARVDEKRAAEPEMIGIGDNSQNNPQDVGGVSGQRLRSFIERIERLGEEKAGIADDIKEVYAEAKGTGFDTPTMRKIVKLRKMDADKRSEEDMLLETYRSALGM